MIKLKEYMGIKIVSQKEFLEIIEEKYNVKLNLNLEDGMEGMGNAGGVELLSASPDHKLDLFF